ncbi:aspartyl protease family protein [Asticcacaulis solisilvae]|uniref:aspartyl protease family protein n=1 Tax=Asticcacaulis solisilvae TaxID=1217274 RepID=UPI003FD7E8E6
MDTSFINAWSRRRALIGIGAAAALPLAAPLAAWGQQVTAGATLQQAPPDPASAQLAAKTDAASHLTVEVHINGRPYRFVVDTAAERSVIADDAAAALGLPSGGLVRVNGLTGRLKVPAVVAAQVELGPFRRQSVLMPVLPRNLLAADGYLGLDVIDGTCVTFDFRNSRLLVEEPAADGMTASSTLAQVRLTGSKGYLRVDDCLVDSVAANAFIDTGAEISVGNGSLLNALRQRNKNLQEMRMIVLTGVTGGEISAEVIGVGRIRLQNLSFTNGELAISDVPDFVTWKLKNRPSLLIGMDYLRQFARVAIDYRAKRVEFELSAAPPKPTPGVEVTAMG